MDRGLASVGKKGIRKGATWLIGPKPLRRGLIEREYGEYREVLFSLLGQDLENALVSSRDTPRFSLISTILLVFWYTPY